MTALTDKGALPADVRGMLPLERLLLGVSRRALLSAAGGLVASLAGVAAARRQDAASTPPGRAAAPARREAPPRISSPPAPPAPPPRGRARASRMSSRRGARPASRLRGRGSSAAGARREARAVRFAPRPSSGRTRRAQMQGAGEERSVFRRLAGALERITGGGGPVEAAAASASPESASQGSGFLSGGGSAPGFRTGSAEAPDFGTGSAEAPEDFVQGPPPDPEPPSPGEGGGAPPAPAPSLPPPLPAGPVGPTVATPAARERTQALSFDPEVQLLAERLSFGPTPALVEEIETLGVEGWLEAQLAPETLDDGVAEAAVAGLPSLTMDNASRRELFRGNRVVAEIRQATLLRALTSRRQLFELMVDFWSNHLNVEVRRRQAEWYKASDDRDVIRTHALGRFADLLQASARSPAMLVYLDNDKNRGSSPNENYGRELLELHTVGVEAGYTEDDVRDSARLLSGWRLRDHAFVFEPREHAAGPKQVLGFATPGVSGLADGEAYLDYLAHHPSTAARIARKLCVRFVSDDPPADLVESVAAAFRANDTAIAPTLRALFAHPAFWASGRAKLRRPFEAWLAMVRATGARVPLDSEDHGARTFHRALEEMGQPLFGQPAPIGYPDRREDWLSAAGLLARFEHAGRLPQGHERGIEVDLEALWSGEPPPTVGDWVTRVIARLLARPVGAATWEALVAAVGEPAEAPFDPEIARARGPFLVGLVLASPDAQLR